MTKPILRENDKKFIELILQEIRKIDEKVLFEISYFPNNVIIKLQSREELRSKLFNKLRSIHIMYGLNFKPTQFIRKINTIISFDLLLSQ